MRFRKSLDRSKPPVLWPAIILVLALLLTGSLWWAVRVQADRVADLRFAVIASDVVNAIDQRMGNYEQVLRGGVAYLNAEGGRVSRQQWAIYVASLHTETEYPGIQGIGLSLRVTPTPVATHEAAMRADGIADYAIHPPGDRDEVHAIVFLEPPDERNRVALGYDMYSEPTRRVAMATARDTGQPTLSGNVTLMQEISPDIQQGVLLYLPVYRGGTVPATVEERRAALIGFVYSPFRMGNLIRAVLGDHLEEVAVRVRDGTVAPETLLFGESELTPSSYRLTSALDLYGRRWVIDVAALPDLEASLTNRYPVVVLLAGLIIGVLLWWLSVTMIAERRRRVALGQANEQLGLARAEAEAAGRSKSKFLAAASHDIRQPVQSLVLLAAGLSRRLAGHSAHVYVTQIEQALDALRLLLNGLLDISRLDAGVIEPEPRPFHVGDLMTRLHHEYAPRASLAGLRLRVVECSKWGLSDPALLERILRNLIENALRYTHDGSILVGCRKSGDVLRIEVRDTGIGIAPSDHAAIFEEFYQVDNPERDRHKGLGLGLAIVRRLAGLLGHRLDVRSEQGRGTCFTIEVPLCAPPLARGRDDGVGVGDAPPLPRRMTVLLIDDEDMVRDALSLTLADWGCDILTAANADAAVAAVDSAGKVPDVVLADYSLQDGCTGLDAIRRLRQHVGVAVPGIILTGDTAPERIAEAARSGHPILHKPINPRDLQRAIKAVAAG